MKQFNLQEYLANPSRQVVTRGGRKVRIVCTDRKNYDSHPIIALVETDDDDERARSFKIDGKWSVDGSEESIFDLFFAPEKHEGWVNIYYRGSYQLGSNVIYRSEDEAIAASEDVRNYINTIKIEWEE